MEEGGHVRRDRFLRRTDDEVASTKSTLGPTGTEMQAYVSLVSREGLPKLGLSFDKHAGLVKLHCFIVYTADALFAVYGLCCADGVRAQRGLEAG